MNAITAISRASNPATRLISGPGAFFAKLHGKSRSRKFSAIAVIATLLCGASSVSAQSILKTAGNYSVLASQGITAAGAGFTFRNGNVGLFPAATSNITGFPPATVSGTTLLGTAATIVSTGGATQQAQADLQVAATGLAAMAQTTNFSNVDMANLGPLPPGVYRWNAAATLTGALVLDAQGKNGVAWVFQFGTGLTTAANSSVKIINAGSNGGSDDGVFWNAATAAIVIGDNNTVLGNYIAYTSITFTGSTTILGGGGVRFLALNAAITFAGPGTLNPLGGPGNSDMTGGLVLNGSSVVLAPAAPVGPPVVPPAPPPGSPVITSAATASGVAGSSSFNFTVAASGSPTSFTASGLPPGLTLNPLTGAITGTPTTAGTYVVTVTATNAAGTSTATTLTITVGAAPVATSRIINFSARAISGPGDATLILGFVVSGDGKNVLVRGVGPTLASLGIVNFLADPMLTIYNAAGGASAVNDDWGTTMSGQPDGSAIASTAARVGAFILPVGSKDAAVMMTLNNGVHTTGLVRANSTSGVGLVEIYDTDQTSSSRLINVSARMNVSAGEGTLIAGLVIGGTVPKTVLIRGVGPTLATLGVSGTLADPQISLFSGATVVASNDNWGTGASTAAQITAASALVGAFPLATGSKDAALLVTLSPGSYTVQVTGVANASGVALIEVYDTQ